MTNMGVGGNYGVNPNIGANPAVNNNAYQQQTFQAAGSNNYNTADGYAFNMTQVPTGRVPNVEVSWWDKLTAGFDDVMKTDDNLRQFKVFEEAMKSNPNAYLKPGSNDVTKVKDLQRKLQYLGYSVNVNGTFGSATEQAVVQFKNSVGINDGYLNKKGQFAVSAIVTPQAWNHLNSQVATRLNPNSGPGSFAPPVTQQELEWAQGLQNKIRQFGYQPNPSERARYDDIFQRQQLQLSMNNGNFDPSTIQPPSQQEVNWAKQLIVKMQQFGYQPSPQEQQRYTDIRNRQQLAKQQPPVQSMQPPQVTPQPVSQQELDWASNMMNQVKAGYKPSPAEEAQYNDIFNRYQQFGVQQTQPNTALTQEDLIWAKQLETRVSQGYQPTQQEKARYEDIYAKYQAQQNQPTNPQTNPTQPVNKPTDQELSWAMELERKVREENYQPNQNELAIYNDIATRLEAFNAQQKTVGSATPEELAWAANMYAKMQQGYQPTQEEMAILNNIQAKVGGQNQTQTTPGPQTQTTPDPTTQQQQNQTGFTYPAELDSVSMFEYNSVTINAFRNAFPGASFMGNAVPYLSPADGMQVASQFGFQSVEQLQSAVGAGVDGKFGPETYFKLVQALKANGMAQPATGTGAMQPSSMGSGQGVTQEELDWAANLQARWQQQGYQPTQQEVDRYTDIYNRYQASGQQVSQPTANTNTGFQPTTTQNQGQVTQQELDWAQNLQLRWQQGYQPTQQEIDQYTSIYNRYNNTQVNPQPPANTNTGFQPTTTPQPTSNVPTTYVNGSSTDPQLQWALNLLDRVQNQGYRPTEQELTQYEQIIAQHQTVPATP